MYIYYNKLHYVHITCNNVTNITFMYSKTAQKTTLKYKESCLKLQVQVGILNTGGLITEVQQVSVKAVLQTNWTMNLLPCVKHFSYFVRWSSYTGSTVFSFHINISKNEIIFTLWNGCDGWHL